MRVPCGSLLNYRKRRLVRRKMSKAEAQARKEYLD